MNWLHIFKGPESFDRVLPHTISRQIEYGIAARRGSCFASVDRGGARFRLASPRRLRAARG